MLRRPQHQTPRQPNQNHHQVALVLHQQRQMEAEVAARFEAMPRLERSRHTATL